MVPAGSSTRGHHARQVDGDRGAGRGIEHPITTRDKWTATVVPGEDQALERHHARQLTARAGEAPPSRVTVAPLASRCCRPDLSGPRHSGVVTGNAQESGLRGADAGDSSPHASDSQRLTISSGSAAPGRRARDWTAGYELMRATASRWGRRHLGAGDSLRVCPPALDRASELVAPDAPRHREHADRQCEPEGDRQSHPVRTAQRADESASSSPGMSTSCGRAAGSTGRCPTRCSRHHVPCSWPECPIERAIEHCPTSSTCSRKQDTLEYVYASNRVVSCHTTKPTETTDNACRPPGSTNDDPSRRRPRNPGRLTTADPLPAAPASKAAADSTADTPAREEDRRREQESDALPPRSTNCPTVRTARD